MEKILVTGACGQIGSDLVPALRKKHGDKNVIFSDIREPKDTEYSGTFEILDITNQEDLEKIVEKHNVTTIFHLASLLSANGEKNPDLAWNVNMSGLKNVLDMGKKGKIKKIFWPSSIAAFGPNTPKEDTPQLTIMDPNTMYGITKFTGELLCNYYFTKYGVDVRSLRYPGIISYKGLPGGGTTDYAIEIFYEALKNKKYTCFLKEDATLPMMYMPDLINATMKIMEADEDDIKMHIGYNLAAFSFSPKELADEIRKTIHDFECNYEPDERQKIADSWPKEIDDSQARNDWGWKPEYTLSEMSKDMLEKLSSKLGLEKPF